MLSRPCQRRNQISSRNRKGISGAAQNAESACENPIAPVPRPGDRATTRAFLPCQSGTVSWAIHRLFRLWTGPRSRGPEQGGPAPPFRHHDRFITTVSETPVPQGLGANRFLVVAPGRARDIQSSIGNGVRSRRCSRAGSWRRTCDCRSASMRAVMTAGASGATARGTPQGSRIIERP